MDNFLLDLPQKIKAIAAEGNLMTPEDVLLKATEDLLMEGCTENDVRVLKEAAAKMVAPRLVPGSQLLKEPLSLKRSRISFACGSIDRCTRGGIVTRGITEICGASGAGKTQLLLQLSLTVQLPLSLGGLAKDAAYICTEDAFPSKRLFQISKSFERRYPEHAINYLSNIHIEHVIESDDLLNCVTQRLGKLMATKNIGLIIIDSVGAVFRLYTDYIQRARDMRKMTNALLHYGDKYQCGVVCVNQVTTVNDNEREIPCLGLAWATLGRTRIKISKVPKMLTIKKQMLTVRKFEIMYSPETPNECAEFIITEHGVMDVP